MITKLTKLTKENPIYVFPEMKLRGLLPNSTFMSWEYINRINRSQIQYMNVEIGRQNIEIQFWKKRGCAVSFLGTHKSEPDIYIGFSTALDLQCSQLIEE